jgi:hypothetical protein
MKEKEMMNVGIFYEACLQNKCGMTSPERPRKGLNLETIAVVLIICAAAGYLIRRYLKRGENVGGCACDDMECPKKSCKGSKARFTKK